MKGKSVENIQDGMEKEGNRDHYGSLKHKYSCALKLFILKSVFCPSSSIFLLPSPSH